MKSVLSIFSNPVVTTNAPKPITIDEIAEGDYCILKSIHGTTLKPMVIYGKLKCSSKDREANKLTIRDTAKGDTHTLKTLNGSEYLNKLLDDYMRKNDGQVMEGIWSFSNLIANAVAIVTTFFIVPRLWFSKTCLNRSLVETIINTRVVGTSGVE